MGNCSAKKVLDTTLDIVDIMKPMAHIAILKLNNDYEKYDNQSKIIIDTITKAYLANQKPLIERQEREEKLSMVM
jgi:hypothetical protein